MKENKRMPPPAAAASSEDGGDPNTMRILLATDIHLGYAEKHPVKGRQGFIGRNSLFRNPDLILCNELSVTA